MHLRHLYCFSKRLFGLLVAMRFLQRAAQLCFQARALRNKRYRCPCLVYRTLGHALLQQHRYLAYVALRRRKRYVIIPAINQNRARNHGLRFSLLELPVWIHVALTP